MESIIGDGEGGSSRLGIGEGYNTFSSGSAAAAAPEDSTTPEELYAVMAILILLSLMGTAGNALVMYVFSQKKDKLVSTLFILVLAFVDFVTCLVVIPYTIYMEYVKFLVDSDFVCKLYQFLITSNIPFSAFIMVAIAVDRYFCICHPFLRAITVFRAKMAVAVLALLAAAIGVCVSLMYGVYTIRNERLVDGNSSLSPAEVLLQSSSTDGIPFDAVIYGDFEADTSSYSVFGRYSEEPDMEKDYADRSIYTGKCNPNELVVSTYFQLTFQKCYTAVYLLCLIVVAVLYVLIYRSVLDRRTRRQNAKSKSLSLVLATGGPCRRQSCPDGEDTLFTTVEVERATEHHPSQQRNGGRHGKVRGRDERDQARSSISIATKRDLNRMANLKTAAMLFVVTVVFVVTFLPAFLMALFLIPYNMTIFYMYFANNVANPVIYSFMNKNFRDDTRRLFCR